MLIKVENLTKEFISGEVVTKVLHGLSFTIEQGEFADEPTGNLDSKSGVQIMEILQRLNNAGNTIILVTHETYTSEHAKRIIQIKDGRIENDYPVINRRVAKDGEMLK